MRKMHMLPNSKKKERKKVANLECLSILDLKYNSDNQATVLDGGIAAGSGAVHLKLKNCGQQSPYNYLESDLCNELLLELQKQDFLEQETNETFMRSGVNSSLINENNSPSKNDSNVRKQKFFTLTQSPISGVNDSVFGDIDLSLLEKECAESSSDKAFSVTNTNQLSSSPAVENDNQHSQSAVSEEHKLANNCEKESAAKCLNNSCNLLTSCTQFQEKTHVPTMVGSITKRMRKRLLENAHNSSQLSNEPICKRSIGERVSFQNNTDFGFMNENQSSDVDTQDVGSFYGLPSQVKELLGRLRGITTLYDWQQECLSLPSVKLGKNLLYCLPTSGGKTLVAEILMLKTLLCRKKDVALVLPFVAIVQEKIQSLAQFAIELGFLVEEYAGSKGRFPPRKRRKRNVAYICTIEKANLLVNSLIENGRLDELNLVVVDEFHMIGEGGRRGAAIEMMLSKILYISESTQIIAMSATLNNTEELATFLHAEIYISNFRPVDLQEYVKVSDSVYKIDSTQHLPEDKLVFDRMIGTPTKELATQDSDHLATLVLEVIPLHSCLIFCPTKKNCENVATMICKLLPKDVLLHKKKDRNEILQSLCDDTGVLCPILQMAIPYGVAYHHSGLTTEERRVIEEAYKNGILSVIACTSTLAAGVNLPARRVIIRSPHVGRSFMSHSQYKQMTGRAGRAGIDTKGESFLIVSSFVQKAPIFDLVCGSVENCISSLMYDGGKGFKALLLNLISLKVIKNTSEIIAFFSQTFFFTQIKTIRTLHPHILEDIECEGILKTINDIANDSLQYLIDLKLIENKSENSLSSTRLGIAIFKGSIDLEFSNKIYNNLRRGLENLVLDSYLHLLYLVTPYEMSAGIYPNWLVYFREFSRLTPTQIAAANLIGIPECYIARKAAGSTFKNKKFDDEIIQRFYVTLMLYALFEGQSVWEVSARFEQSRGFLQNLLTASTAFASCVLHFTKELQEFWPYHGLLENLIQILQYCTISELVPLMEISGVKLARAKQLYNTGYKTLAHVAAANADDLVHNILHLSKKQALQVIASAKMILTEKIESLQEEVEELKFISQPLNV